jgi:hypothetical protein
MTHKKIPTNNFLFPSTLHWLDMNLKVVALGTSIAKVESSFTYVQMYIIFLQNFQNFVGMLPAWLPCAPM